MSATPPETPVARLPTPLPPVTPGQLGPLSEPSPSCELARTAAGIAATSGGPSATASHGTDSRFRSAAPGVRRRRSAAIGPQRARRLRRSTCAHRPRAAGRSPSSPPARGRRRPRARRRRRRLARGRRPRPMTCAHRLDPRARPRRHPRRERHPPRSTCACLGLRRLRLYRRAGTAGPRRGDRERRTADAAVVDFSEEPALELDEPIVVRPPAASTPDEPSPSPPVSEPKTPAILAMRIIVVGESSRVQLRSDAPPPIESTPPPPLEKHAEPEDDIEPVTPQCGSIDAAEELTEDDVAPDSEERASQSPLRQAPAERGSRAPTPAAAETTGSGTDRTSGTACRTAGASRTEEKSEPKLELPLREKRRKRSTTRHAAASAGPGGRSCSATTSSAPRKRLSELQVHAGVQLHRRVAGRRRRRSGARSRLRLGPTRGGAREPRLRRRRLRPFAVSARARRRRRAGGRTSA